MSQPLKTFICYAREDHSVKESLRKHLKPLVDERLLHLWHDGEIPAGKDWDKAIKAQLAEADLVLMLISVDFVNSEYINGTELKLALQRHDEGLTLIVPIIVRRCKWERHFEMGRFNALPKEARPIQSFAPDLDEAYFQVAEGIEHTAKNLLAEREREHHAQTERDLREARDHAAWQVAEERDTPEAYENYLKSGFTLHKPDALRRIGELEKEKMRREEAERLTAEAQRAKEAARKKAEQEAAAKADPFHALMLPIKGGTFDMGSKEYDSEKPIHKVTVRDFHLCKYPVTQAQWKQIMGKNPSHFTGDDNLPVEQVSWDDTQVFLKKLNEKTGKTYRLPTEAEWEYAAKGGNQSKGFKYAGSNDLKEVGWYWENSGDKPLSGDWKSEKVIENNCRTHPVGQKKPNELGLYDMSGNVWEWCEDDWHGDYKGAPADGSAWTKGGGSGRVLRGGSWYINVNYCRSAYRNYYEPDYRDYVIGCRLAQD